MKTKKTLFVIAISLLALICACSCGQQQSAERIIEEPRLLEDKNKEPEKPQPVVDTQKAYIYDAHAELTPVNYGSPALVPATEDAGMEYIDKFVFICDSPTYWFKLEGLLTDGKNTKQIWTGPEGTQTLGYMDTYKLLDPNDGVQKLTVDMVEEHKPEYIVIALGINGIGVHKEEAFRREYKKLVTSIMEKSPDSIILCSSIYPINQKYRYYNLINNERITKGNSWILEIAEELGVHYLDTYAALLDENGVADPALMRGDGLHPNRAGLEKLLEYYRTHAYIPEPEPVIVAQSR